MEEEQSVEFFSVSCSESTKTSQIPLIVQMVAVPLSLQLLTCNLYQSTLPQTLNPELTTGDSVNNGATSRSSELNMLMISITCSKVLFVLCTRPTVASHLLLSFGILVGLKLGHRDTNQS